MFLSWAILRPPPLRHFQTMENLNRSIGLRRMFVCVTLTAVSSETLSWLTFLAFQWFSCDQLHVRLSHQVSSFTLKWFLHWFPLFESLIHFSFSFHSCFTLAQRLACYIRRTRHHCSRLSCSLQFFARYAWKLIRQNSVFQSFQRYLCTNLTDILPILDSSERANPPLLISEATGLWKQNTSQAKSILCLETNTD